MNDQELIDLLRLDDQIKSETEALLLLLITL